MTPFEAYWDRIFCINLDRRIDRWQHVQEQCHRYGLTKVERFSAFEVCCNPDGGIDPDGINCNGNAGCTASHRTLLDLIAYHQWSRVLILEDDFNIVHDDFHAEWEKTIPFLPQQWDFLYLGGHYAEKPLSRLNERIVRCGAMMTTSSYGITAAMAKTMLPYIYGHGPIDALYFYWNRRFLSYILQPRLMVQYPSYSDLQNQHADNRACMLDKRHERTV